MEKDILKHLSLNIEQLDDSHILIKLKHKDQDIGEAYTIESKLGYVETRGFSGRHTSLNHVKLIISKLP